MGRWTVYWQPCVCQTNEKIGRLRGSLKCFEKGLVEFRLESSELIFLESCFITAFWLLVFVFKQAPACSVFCKTQSNTYYMRAEKVPGMKLAAPFLAFLLGLCSCQRSFTSLGHPLWPSSMSSIPLPITSLKLGRVLPFSSLAIKSIHSACI